MGKEATWNINYQFPSKSLTFRPAKALPFLKYPFGQSGASLMALSASRNALKKEGSKLKHSYIYKFIKMNVKQGIGEA